jgi:CheY-like chemotaxis protein
VRKSEHLPVGESIDSPAQVQGHFNPSPRILVVDDDADIRQVNTAVLNRFGYQTVTAEDGAAAWDALLASHYDLLITDHNMPRISGIELIKKLRAARMTLPVILVSGDLPGRELEQNAWLKPVATLPKPFSAAQLLDTVNEVLAPPTG